MDWQPIAVAYRPYSYPEGVSDADQENPRRRRHARRRRHPRAGVQPARRRERGQDDVHQQEAGVALALGLPAVCMAAALFVLLPVVGALFGLVFLTTAFLNAYRGIRRFTGGTLRLLVSGRVA